MPIKYRTYKFFPYPNPFAWDDPFNTFRAPTPNFRIPGVSQVVRGGELGATIVNQLGSFGRIGVRLVECVPGSSCPGQEYGETAIAVQSRFRTATKFFKSLTAVGNYDGAWGSIGGALPAIPVDGQTIRLANFDNDEVRLYAYADGAWRYVQETVIDPIMPILTINGALNGTSIPVPGAYPCLLYSVQSVLSFPDPGFGLDTWTFDGIPFSDVDPIIFGMDLSHAIEPQFDNDFRTLIINAPQGTGMGFASSPPQGTYYVKTGNLRHLAAGFSFFPFLHWVESGVNFSGDYVPNIDVTMDVDHDLTPWNIDTGSPYIQMSTAGAGAGTTNPPFGYNICSWAESVDLLAIPDPGSAFDRWEIDGIYFLDNPHNLIVNWGVTVVAVFS